MGIGSFYFVHKVSLKNQTDTDVFLLKNPYFRTVRNSKNAYSTSTSH